MCEEFLICSIHLSEVVHSRQENVDFHDLADIGSRSFEDGRQIVDAEFGHFGDRGGLEGEEGARGIAGDLSGTVDRRRCSDSLRIGASGCKAC